MKKATDNKQRYKDAFDRIQLSEEAYRQIRNMEETRMDTNFRKNKRRKAVFPAIVSLASLAIVFLSANGIVYAATGDSLVDKITQRVSIYIDGEPAGGGNVKFGTDKDGNPYYEIDVDEKAKSDSPDKKDSAEINISSFIADPINPEKADENETTSDKNGSATDSHLTREGETGDSAENFKTTIKQKNNKIFFLIERQKSEPMKIDITKDFTDGKASGTFEMDGGQYQYSITGNVKEYSVKIENLENTSK